MHLLSSACYLNIEQLRKKNFQFLIEVAEQDNLKLTESYNAQPNVLLSF